MKKIIRLIAIVIFAGAAIAGGVWFYQSRIAAQSTAGTEPLTQVIAVQQGDLSASIDVVGALEAKQQATLSFDRMDGTAALLSLSVAAGNTVEAGQALATIDPAPYEQALDQARSALQKAEETLAELRTPPSELEITQAELAVANARLELEQAQADLADLTAAADVRDEQQAVQNAEDNLKLVQLQQALAEHDSLAQSERDLSYAVDWRQRHIWELQALVESAKANLEQTEDLAEEKETLAEAQADLALVQARRKIALQAAAAEIATAQVELADAQEALAEAQAGSAELDLAAAQVAVEEATVNLQAAQEARAELEEGADPVELAAAQADVDEKRLAVSEAEADLAGATLTAPFAGAILQTNAEPGDRINSSSEILTIANLNELQVIASVDETTIRQVQAGQQASIAFDAFPDQTFRGQVLSVPLQGALQGDVMVYDVPISLAGADALPLLVGMTANVEIQVGQVSDALLVPTMAVQTIAGLAQVLVPNPSDPANPVAVPVEIGLSNGAYTQIVRGLNAGDQVVVQLSDNESNTFGPGGGMMIMMDAGGPPPDRPPGNRQP